MAKDGTPGQDEYGEPIIHRVEITTETVAFVTRRHGAYLIMLSGDRVNDAGHDSLYDCASSKTLAKRVAREMAVEIGYVGPFRWVIEHGLLELKGTNVQEWDQYVDS